MLQEIIAMIFQTRQGKTICLSSPQVRFTSIIVYALCISLLLLIPTGCGLIHKTPVFGQQSFTIIEEVLGDSFVLGGYSHFYDSRRSSTYEPQAVLVVGVNEGVKLGGQNFDYGSIVVVEGTIDMPVFRLARSNDKIRLREEVSIFGKKYGKGAFKVPSDGKIAP